MHIFLRFILMNYCVITEVLGFDFNVLVTNITIEMSESYQTKCIKLLKPDNLTWLEMYDFYVIQKKLSESHLSGVYSVDDYIKRITRDQRSFSCSKPMQIVLGTEKLKKSYAKLSKRYPMSKGIWLIFLNSSPILEFFKDARLTFNVQAIVADVVNVNFVKFYEIYRVDENFPLRAQAFGNWTIKTGLNIIKGSIHARRYDLEGKVLKTGSEENWPFTSFRTSLDINQPWDGLYSRVWKELETLLNFTSVNIRSSGAGIQNENGTWNGLIGMILRNEIDVIVSELKVTNERLEVLDFTYPLISSCYQVFFRQLNYNLQWDAIFNPFYKDVWIAIIIWILAGTLSFSFCYYYTLLYGFEDMRSVQSPTESFFFMLQTLCQQGSPKVPKSASCRVLFYSSYLVSSVLIPSYAASLISSLTNHVPYRPFDSLEELLHDGKYELYVEENTSEYSYFANSTDITMKSIFQKLLRTISVDPESDLVNEIEILCKNAKTAIFGIEVAINSKIEMSRYQDCKIISFTKYLTKVQESMALTKNHPYTGLFNYYIHKLGEIGVMERLNRLIFIKKGGNPSGLWTPVEKEEVFQIFAIFLTGALISTAFLLIECFFNK